MPRPFRHGGSGTVAALSLWLVPVLALADPAVTAGEGIKTDHSRLSPGLYPAVPTDDAPFFDVDWSSSLRGSYAKSGERDSFEVLLVPGFALTHEGRRANMAISGEAEVTRPVDGEIDVTGLRLGLGGSYALDSVTVFDADANLALSQDLPGAPGLDADVAMGAREISGDVNLGLTRQFGLFNIGVTGAVGREVYGETLRVDGTSTDNSARDLWTLEGGLRVGFQATPIFEVFGEAGLGRDIFDEVSPDLAVKPDATNRSIKAGVVGRWSEVLQAEASVGVGLRDFDAGGLGDVTARLYDARVIYRPDPTWRFQAALSTDFGSPDPDEAGTTRVQYRAVGEAAYTVNSWLDLRALAEWRLSQIDDGREDERGVGYGLGADYRLGPHTDLSADYSFERTEDATDGREDSHRVTLGITVAR